MLRSLLISIQLLTHSSELFWSGEFPCPPGPHGPCQDASQEKYVRSLVSCIYSLFSWCGALLLLLCYFNSKWQQKSKQALTMSNLPFSPIFLPNPTFVNRPSSPSQDNLHITPAMRTTLSYTSTAWHELRSTWLHVKINCGALKIPMLKQHPTSEFGACLFFSFSISIFFFYEGSFFLGRVSLLFKPP